MSNIRAVSKAAGVSVATVSRTFSAPDSVREKTRHLVEQIAAELDYRPNLMARNFRAQRSYAIMVLVPDISNPFFSRVISGLENAALARGYSVLLGNTGRDPERESRYAAMVQNGQADGIIQLSAIYPLEPSARNDAVPLVNICECFEAPNVPQVMFDNVGGAKAVVEHLLDLGHRRIGLVKGRSDSPLTDDRLAGCRAAFAARELELDDALVVDGDFTIHSGHDAVDRLLALAAPPTAIFCFSDEMALGAIQRIKSAGLVVPGDISVAGFDDIAFASYCDPPLTTVAQPAEIFGERAVDLLCDLIDRGKDAPPGDVPSREILPFQLAIRASVAPPKNGENS